VHCPSSWAFSRWRAGFERSSALIRCEGMLGSWFAWGWGGLGRARAGRHKGCPESVVPASTRPTAMLLASLDCFGDRNLPYAIC
jgi:hypothetical protein